MPVLVPLFSAGRKELPGEREEIEESMRMLNEWGCLSGMIDDKGLYESFYQIWQRSTQSR